MAPQSLRHPVPGSLAIPGALTLTRPPWQELYSFTLETPDSSRWAASVAKRLR